ncbi:MAG: methylmalonyl-CoA epimerase [Bellilinea sp.]
MIKIKKINHIGIAAENLEKSMWFWNDVLGLTLMNVEEVPSHKVKVAFLRAGDSDIELLTPLEGNFVMGKFVQEKGGGLDHLCLEVENIEAVLVELQENGIKLLDETPKVLPGRKIAFVHPSSLDGVLLEFYELI